LLARHFVRRYSRELGREVRDIAPEALDRLREYSWPGNIRELQSVLKQALLQASGAALLPAFLPELGSKLREPAAATDATDALDLNSFIKERFQPETDDLYAQTHREVDRLLLRQVLEYTSGNQHQAARVLGIARQTLRQKLRDLGLHVGHAVKTDEEESS
jgi:DNA-binding NtrC family response regulator